MSMKSLSELENFAGTKFGLGYPVEEFIKLSDPDDDPLAAWKYLLKTCTMSFIMASYGIRKAAAEDMLRLMRSRAYVSVTLDNRFVADESLNGILSLAEQPSNSLAFADLGVTTTGVVDGLDVFLVTEDSLVVTRQPVLAARERNRLDLIHGAAAEHRG